MLIMLYFWLSCSIFGLYRVGTAVRSIKDNRMIPLGYNAPTTVLLMVYNCIFNQCVLAHVI